METRLTGGKLQKSGIFFVLIFLLLMAISLTSLNTSSAASTLYVNGTDGNDSYDGTTATWVSGTIGPKKTIQNASNAVDTSGTVYVTSGTYNEHITIAKSLNLIGANPVTTIINGTNNGRPILVNSGISANITNLTIQNGFITGEGGGIYSSGNLNINNCFIIGNTATTYGGGIYTTSNMTVNNTTITRNTASTGGGIFSAYNTLNVRNSRLINNTATYYSEISLHMVVSADARYNWWGQNAGPQSGQTSTSLISSPWIYMNLTANPTLILNGATSTLTANFNNAYDGTTITPLNPSIGHIPDNTIVTFTTDLGSVGSHTTTKNTINGIATATLTANEGIGTAHITSQLDNQKVNTTVGIETLYVNGAIGNNTWDGSSPTHISGTTGPLKTIQTAVNAINSGGTINVASGIYNVSGDYYGHITITKSLNLIGTNVSTTIINGDNNGRLIFINGGLNITIANLTLRNGNSSGTGGAIATLSNLTLINCNLTQNTAYDGGAIYSNSGITLNITNSTLTLNNAINAGGAIFNSGFQSVNGSIFTYNTALCGGAIYNSIGTLNTVNINNSILTGNTASTTAGAIFNMGTATITKSILTDNIATSSGGAVLNGETGNLTVNNSTLTGNIGASAGALYNRGTATMHFNRIVNNSLNAIYTFTVIDTEYNWWGSNLNPSSQFTGPGTVNYGPWLYMTLNVNPTLILEGTTSKLTANFNNAYDGTTITPINPTNGHIPDNSLVTFTTDLGSVGSPTTNKNTNNGIATATLTADAGIGTANITAQLDSQTLTTTIEITNTLYVNGDTGDDSYDGLSPTFISGTKTGPLKTITNALKTLNKAGIDGTINVASGTYTENLAIETNVNLIGNNTIITTPDPNNPIITIGNIKKALISGFTIQGATKGIGILINGGILTLQNNNIHDNNIGIVIEKELKPSTITQNNITNNKIGITTASDVNINYNSLLNNIDISSNFEELIKADNNWWGSNSEPTGRTDGNINYNPWLVLTVNATPNLIKKDATSNITADLNHDSNGDPVIGHIMNGTPITFTTTLGTINNTLYTQNGSATATLNGGSISEIADITTTLDKEEIHTPVTVDATTPTITTTDPPNGATNIPTNKIINITFNKNIQNGNNWIELKNNTGTPQPYTTTINGKILTITPTNPLTENKYSILIHTGAITDLAGNPTTSSYNTFSTGTSPTITTTDPPNGATNIPANKIINITFNENIQNGNNWIELKNNTGTPITFSKTINTKTLTITPTNPLPQSTYTILIHTGAITDQAGNPVGPSTNSFTVDTTAPTITTTDPPNGATNVPTNKVITITFNENIQNGNNWIELKNNTGTPQPYTTTINGKILTITPTNPLTENKYSILIHTGAITDLAGNPTTSSYNTFSTGTSPTITTTDPPNGATNIPANKIINITFNENIQNGNNWIELKNNTGTAIPYTTTINGKILTITPTNPLTENKYSILIHTGAITDLAGNPVTSSYNTFSTGPSPTITTTDPPNGATNIPANKAINITFNENIQNGTGWIELKNNTGTTIPYTKSITGNVLTITPSSMLAKAVTYMVIIHTGAVTDIAGNPVASYLSTFTTTNT